MNRVCPHCALQTPEEICPNDGTATDAADPLATRRVGAVAGGAAAGPAVRGGAASAAVAAEPKNAVGTVIAKRYEVTAIIGQGGFGAVYRARHLGTGDIVAIKLLHADHMASAEMTARFQQEAAVTASLKQPHTVRVFDFGQTDQNDLYITMEFLDGKTLSKVMQTESPIGYERTGQMMLQVLKSLAEAHEKGLVHRDLKPDNIFLQNVHGEDDFVKVLDFGMAKLLIAGDGGAKTATGVIIGTPPYMSPEQARGSGVDARTDLYALGCILYQMLTGQLAFAAGTAMDTLIKRITEPPPRAHGRCLTATPDEVCDVVLHAMGTRADERFQTAKEFAKALTKALKSQAMTQVVVAEGDEGYDPAFAGDPDVISSALAAPTLMATAPRPAPLSAPHSAANSAANPAASAPRATVTGAEPRVSQSGIRAAAVTRQQQPSDYVEANATGGMAAAAGPAEIGGVPTIFGAMVVPVSPVSSSMPAVAPLALVENNAQLQPIAVPAPASKTSLILAAAAGAVILVAAGWWLAGRGAAGAAPIPAAAVVAAPVTVAAKVPEILPPAAAQAAVPPPVAESPKTPTPPTPKPLEAVAILPVAPTPAAAAAPAETPAGGGKKPAASAKPRAGGRAKGNGEAAVLVE